MKAVTRHHYGSPEQISIKNFDQPSPAPDELLVKVYATTVSRTDCVNLTAQPFFMRFILGLHKPRQAVMGTDFAGEVVGRGDEATSFSVGDRVFGFRDTGCASQAEYLTIPAEHAHPIPEAMDYSTAVAGLEGGSYAYSFFRRSNLRAGEDILINGATGAIGSALLQLVRQKNVRITATCNPQNVELICSLGANETIDFTSTDFTKTAKKYDCILDAAGKSYFGKCKPLLTQNGRYISSELGPYAQNLLYVALTLATDKKVVFPVPFSTNESIPYLSNLLTTGAYRPVIDRTYALENAKAAYEYVIKGQKTGNVILNCAG